MSQVSRKTSRFVDKYDVKLEDVFFGQFATVNSVRMPRYIADKRLFCGTALVEFSTDEDAEKVLNQRLIYSGTELELKPKKGFGSERAKQAEVKNTSSQVCANHKNSSSVEADHPKGLSVVFTLKSMSV
ncbi:unnamed protein product [Camellia sinensis]